MCSHLSCCFDLLGWLVFREGNKMNEDTKSHDTSTRAVFLSIVGKPNVGKSSLLNMLVGCKASIVSSKPNTTRNRICGVLTDGGTQIVFTDAPGLLNTKTMLDTYMVKEISDAMSGSDACLHVIEAGCGISSLDAELISRIDTLKVPSILVINKVDLLKNKSVLLGQMKEFIDRFDYWAIVPVSAKTGCGRGELLSEIKKLAVPSIFYFPENQVTDQQEGKMISELIREKVLRFLNAEIPHGVAVYVSSVNRRGGIIDVDSCIYCEKMSHKGIIIGKRGTMLKKIGSSAREDIEKLLGGKVNLKIWVKVKEGWKNKQDLLKTLGYSV